MGDFRSRKSLSQSETACGESCQEVLGSQVWIDGMFVTQPTDSVMYFFDIRNKVNRCETYFQILLSEITVLD